MSVTITLHCNGV